MPAADFQVVRHHTGRHYVTALRGPAGRKLLPLVYITDAGVRRRSVPLHIEPTLRPMKYPVARAVRIFQRAGKRLGITAGARELLRAAVTH